jgi:hypothetical protein
VFVGYEPGVKGWRLMIAGADGGWRVVISRDVKFVEHTPGYPAVSMRDADTDATLIDVDALFPELEEPELPSPVPAPEPQAVDAADAVADGGADASATESTADAGHTPDVNQAPAGITGTIDGVRTSNRVRAQPHRFDPSAYGMSGIANTLTDEPQSLAEINRRPDKRTVGCQYE